MESEINRMHQTTGFSKVFVNGTRMTFSGGPRNSTQTQTINVHKTPDGTLYLDNQGSVCTEFSPENGVVTVRNALGITIMWKREGAKAVTNQPNSLMNQDGGFNPTNIPGSTF